MCYRKEYEGQAWQWGIVRTSDFLMHIPKTRKTRAWIWMKCCVSTDVGTWTNWLTFEHDPDHRPDAGTGLLSPISYRLYGTLQPCLGCQRAARYAEFYVGKIPPIPIGGAPLERAVVLKWFYSLSRRKTFVGGKCCLPSALLVIVVVQVWGWKTAATTRARSEVTSRACWTLLLTYCLLLVSHAPTRWLSSH